MHAKLGLKGPRYSMVSASVLFND